MTKDIKIKKTSKIQLQTGGKIFTAYVTIKDSVKQFEFEFSFSKICTHIFWNQIFYLGRK